MVDKFYFGNKTREIASKGKRKLKEAPKAINKGGAIILKGPKTGFINRQRKRFEDAQERRLERQEARLAQLERKADLRERIVAQKARIAATKKRAGPSKLQKAARSVQRYTRQKAPPLPKTSSPFSSKKKQEQRIDLNKIFRL